MISGYGESKIGNNAVSRRHIKERKMTESHNLLSGDRTWTVVQEEKRHETNGE
jgi:hypothetical protein